MPRTGDYIVVHLVESVPVGTQFECLRGAWPLHITLATWFSCDKPKVLQTKLDEIARTTKPYTVEVGEEALFGPNNDVPVNVIADQTKLAKLHVLLVQVVEASAGIFEPAVWANKGYRAHITHHGKHRRQLGDREVVDDFHLVHLLPQNICEVIDEYRLEASHETAT